MPAQKSEFGPLKTQVFLLLVLCLCQWTQQTLATPCEGGEMRMVSKGVKKCCPKCVSDTGKGMMCLLSLCFSLVLCVSQGIAVWGTGACVNVS